MGEEKRKFRLRVEIKDSDGKIKELIKVAEIKINFNGNRGRASSVKKKGREEI